MIFLIDDLNNKTVLGIRLRWILRQAALRALEDEKQWHWAQSNMYYGA